MKPEETIGGWVFSLSIWAVFLGFYSRNGSIWGSSVGLKDVCKDEYLFSCPLPSVSFDQHVDSFGATLLWENVGYRPTRFSIATRLVSFGVAFYTAPFWSPNRNALTQNTNLKQFYHFQEADGR